METEIGLKTEVLSLETIALSAARCYFINLLTITMLLVWGTVILGGFLGQ